MKNLRFGISVLLLFSAVSWALAQDKHGGRPLSATLTGAAEVPGPGDADGTGTGKITLNHGQGQICYELAVSNIGASTAAHIHIGGPTVAGPVVVGLEAPADGSSEGCVDLDKEKIKAIMKDPANYYINVHNAEFPDGAVRGQLTK
jgi:CHRD domain